MTSGPFDLQRWLLANLAPLLLAQAVVILLVIAVMLRQRAELRRLRGHYEALTHGVDGQDLRSILEAHLARVDQAERQAAELRRALDQLRAHERTALKHVGLLRYDAFDGVGGQVSFALALLDDDANGFVLNSLFGRDGCTTFLKPVRAGRSDIGLSDEEDRVLSQAMGSLREAPTPGHGTIGAVGGALPTR